MVTSKELGKLVQFHRKKSGLTQKQLADLAGIGKTAVLDVEKGKETVQWNTITKILTVLNINIFFDSKMMRDYRTLNETEPKDAAHA